MFFIRFRVASVFWCIYVTAFFVSRSNGVFMKYAFADATPNNNGGSTAKRNVASRTGGTSSSKFSIDNNDKENKGRNSNVFQRRTADDSTDFYSYDGRYNNLRNPQWGAKGEGRIRSIPPANGYSDSVGTPMTSPNLPSASDIMMQLFSRITPNSVTRKRNKNRPNPSTGSQLLAYFGEFITRDISVSETNTSDPMPIECPNDDDNNTLTSRNEFLSVLFCAPGRTNQPFFRSQYTEGYDPEHPRVPITTRSAFLDLGHIYGHDEETVRSLRTGEGGELALSENGLPLRDPETGNFIAEDAMTRSNPGLLALAIIFTRYHNILARRFADIIEDADDELLFHVARMENIAVYQNIVEEKYLPTILGDTLHPYERYNATVNPTVDVFFTTVAFRYGHSAVSGNIRVLDKDYEPMDQYDPLLLREIFNNMETWIDILAEDQNSDINTINISGIEPFLRGLSVEPEKDTDLSIVPDMNVYTKLVSVFNVQRGRDHGIPPYNDVRAGLGLSTFDSFGELLEQLGGAFVDPDLVDILNALYGGDIGLLDAYVGALLETEFGFETNGLVGPTMAMSIKEQFTRIRDGDRLWYKGRYLHDHIQKFPSLSELIQTVFPTEEMILFPKDSFAQMESGDDVCPEAAISSLSLLSGAYTATWQIHKDDNRWIDLSLTVGEKVEGGYIGIGWGTHVMHDSIIWFCTDDPDINRDSLSACDESSQISTTVFTCCVSRGENHLVPKCLSADDSAYYRIDVVRECLSEETTSVTIRAPVCSSDNNDLVAAGNCLNISGPVDYIAAYSPSSQSRSHGSGRRSMGTVDFTHTGIGADTVLPFSDHSGLYALHGIVMLSCWLVLAPLAVFIVRYMKHHPWYLFAHVTLMTACGSVTFPLMIGALVTALERQASMHRWMGVIVVVLFPFISGTGAIRRLSLDGTVSFKVVDQHILRIHYIAGWTILILTFWNCYLGLIRIGPMDSYIEFMSVDSVPIGYDFPIFGVIQRYVFWPYVCLVIAVFGFAELYRRHAFGAFRRYRERAGIWGDMDLSKLEPMTSEEFNEATHYGKQLCIVDGCVLDIGDFRDQHPGGKRVMRFAAGTDITLELLGKRSVDGIYHHHSPFAFGRLKTLVIARMEVSKTNTQDTGRKDYVPGASESIERRNSTTSSISSASQVPQGIRGKMVSPFSAILSNKRKDILRECERESTAIFVTAQINCFKKVTPLLSTMDKPVIQISVLVPTVSESENNDDSPSVSQTERIYTAAPGSVCVLRLRDERGDIIERSQTPVRVRHLTNGDVIYEFFVSMVPGGKLSTALRKMKEGKNLLLRRPNVDHSLMGKINIKMWPVVLLLAAGTGLSSMLQLIDYLLSDNSNKKGYFSASQTKIFLVWVIKSRDHNYIDVCGMKQRVQRSNGNLKWIIVHSTSSNEPDDGIDVNQQLDANAANNDTERGRRRMTLRFEKQKRIGDLLDDTSNHNSSVFNSLGALDSFFETENDEWNGGYLTGRLDGALLGNIVTLANSNCALASRSSVLLKKRVAEAGKVGKSSKYDTDDLSNLGLDLEEGNIITAKSKVSSLGVVGKYDNLLVAVSGRPKFEDECLDNLLLLGLEEEQIIRFTDF